MTFQEATTVIYADQGTHDSETMQKAIDTVKFFEDNVLELEDYETDQLYKSIDYINNNKLGGIEMNNKTVTVAEIEEMVTELNSIIKVVTLQNSFIDFVPAYRNIKDADDLKLNYMRLNDTLDNLYDINQNTVQTLDDMASKLYDISEQLEEQEANHNER